MPLEITQAASGKAHVPERPGSVRDSLADLVKERIAFSYCSDCLTWVVGIYAISYCYSVIHTYG